MVLQKGHITALQHLQMAEVGYRTKYRMFQATGLKKSSYICDLWLTCNKIQTPQGFSQSQHLIIFSTCFFLRFQKRWAPYWNLLIQQGSFSKVFKYLTAFRNQRSRDSPQHSLASHKHITPQLPSSRHRTRPSLHPHQTPTEEAMSQPSTASFWLYRFRPGLSHWATWYCWN